MSFTCRKCGEFWPDAGISMVIADMNAPGTDHWRVRRCASCELRVFSAALRGFLRDQERARSAPTFKQGACVLRLPERVQPAMISPPDHHYEYSREWPDADGPNLND